jgi:hypothetical protein
MESPDEYKALVKPLNDKARKTARIGKLTVVPHKFTDDGHIPQTPQEVVLSKLNLNDLKFLQAWRENLWNDEKTLGKLGLQPEQAEKTFKKLAYFKTEDARIKALASEATPERVLAKDMENIESGALNDSQHKSLDRVAKITGAFKTTGEAGGTINIFNFPKMPPEVEAQMRALADKAADIVDTTGTAL